ncbi:MAG: phospho-N-acetylmuramoyl-pentapeptide-transferase [Clostridia bacterium]|nr:phospho-N-acetylmuramoyl-pentapeptide-transferase [Clostridia bacterium]
MFNSHFLVGFLAFALTLVVTAVLEKLFIPALMRIKMGQTILEIGPRWHKSKEGTPTMGGLFFIGGILVSALAFGVRMAILEGDNKGWKVLCMMLGFGAIGFIDDFVKFVKKRNKGLSALQKLVLQFAVSALFLFAMKDSLSTSLALPFTDFRLELGVFYWPFSILYITFLVNAVNLTDGIDGLAAGNSFVVGAFFTLLALLGKSGTQTVLWSALCGGMIGFLIYNYYPARIFMGDTGSLFLGGALAGAGYWLDNPLVSMVCGLWFVWEALSVVIQVISFKLTKKRVFKMSPFHHHMELCGWKEPGIVAVTVAITAALCVLSYFAF